MEFKAKVRTCLWFNDNGHEAAEYYVSLLPDSHIDNTVQPDPNAPPLVVEFTIAGAPYMVLNGGPEFTHSPAASISVLTKDQEETDSLWDALIEGGAEGQCGWLKDRFGFWWQIVPEAMPRMLADHDRESAGRVQQAMMTMGKIDIAALELAFQGGK